MFGRPCQIKVKKLENDLVNETDHLVIPLNNVYKPLDADFHRESSNKHDDESTLKETEAQRKTNLSKNNNIWRNITNRERPEHCIKERYIENQCETSRRKIVPENHSYASTAEYGKNIFVVGDSHSKRITKRRFNNSFEKAFIKSFIKSFPGAIIGESAHYVVPHLNVQRYISYTHRGRQYKFQRYK